MQEDFVRALLRIAAIGTMIYGTIHLTLVTLEGIAVKSANLDLLAEQRAASGMAPLEASVFDDLSLLIIVAHASILVGGLLLWFSSRRLAERVVAP